MIVIVLVLFIVRCIMGVCVFVISCLFSLGLAVGAVTRSLSGGVGSAAALALLCGVFASMPLPTESEKKLNKAHD